jgi:PIN domain nuclease of toxin-antitoxin system
MQRCSSKSEPQRHHLDPFDRVLIEHALHDDVEVMTRFGF